MATAITRAHAALRSHALTYPDTKEDFPWGETAIKINGKVFLFMYLAKDALNLSVKLPVSGKVALALPFATPTGYGLGKSGWVTARFAARNPACSVVARTARCQTVARPCWRHVLRMAD